VRVNVSAYNEAGELVGVIAQGLIYEEAVHEFFFQDGVDSINDGNGTIAIVFPDEGNRGPVTLYWAGNDGDGTALSNGSYIIRVESVDSVGIATVITGTASILRSVSLATIRIFNEAGELVYSRQVAAGGLQQSEIEIQGTVVDPSLPDGSPGSTLNIGLGALNVAWTGVDQSGRPLANGEYLLEIHIQNGSVESLITETLTVLSSVQQAAGSLQLNPNPVAGNGPVAIRVPAGSLGGTLRVYTVSGELVRRIGFSGDNASWDLKDGGGSTVSAGLYLVLAESENLDGSISRAMGRLVVIR